MRLVEFESKPLLLKRKDLEYLLGLVKGGLAAERGLLQAITPTTTSDVYEIRPGPFVGRLGLPSGGYLDFESRFQFEDVVSLIVASGKLPSYLHRFPSSMEGGKFLLDLIAEAFTRETEHIVGRGLAKGYITRRFISPPYPGRIDTAFHLSRQQARPDKLATRARRLTTQIPSNESIAQALDVLSRVPIQDRGLAIRIRRLGAAFRAIVRRPRTATEMRNVTSTRLHFYYGAALELAATIVEGASLVPEGSGLSGASILYYMPKVWEGCVVNWVSRQWGPAFRVEATTNFDLTSQGELRFQADVLVYQGKRITALYDAKYKQPGDAPDAADVYQMVTYCERLGLGEATLVYPAHLEPKEFVVGQRTIRMQGMGEVLASPPTSAEHLRPV